MIDKLTPFGTDADGERAVSPVIGVILMVAITVILAAVIASFVLGLGDTDDPAPNIVFEDELTNDDENYTISISSGDTNADGDNLQVYVNGTHNGTWISSDNSYEAAEDLGAGQQITSNSEEWDNATIELIWEDNGTSDILAEFEVPDEYEGSESD